MDTDKPTYLLAITDVENDAEIIRFVKAYRTITSKPLIEAADDIRMLLGRDGYIQRYLLRRYETKYQACVDKIIFECYGFEVKGPIPAIGEI